MRLNVAVVAIAMFRRHKFLDVHADEFVCAVAEDLPGSAIAGLDRSGVVDRDNRIVGIVENGSSACLAVTQRFFDCSLIQAAAHAQDEVRAGCQEWSQQLDEVFVVAADTIGDTYHADHVVAVKERQPQKCIERRVAFGNSCASGIGGRLIGDHDG